MEVARLEGLDCWKSKCIYQEKVEQELETCSPLGELCKSHFCFVSLDGVPFNSAAKMEFMVEEYYDTANYTLLQNSWWLRKTGRKWNLKCVDDQNSTVNEDSYFLSYTNHNDEAALSKVKEMFGLTIKNLKRYAIFQVVRYTWEKDMIVDVCQFANDDFYIIGTFHPVTPGKMEINGVRNINSKIVEYISKYIPDLLKYIKNVPVPLEIELGHVQIFNFPKTDKKKQEEQKQENWKQNLLDKLSPEEIEENEGCYVVFSHNFIDREFFKYYTKARGSKYFTARLGIDTEFIDKIIDTDYRIFYRIYEISLIF